VTYPHDHGDRALALDGLVNVRDLGGLPTKDGRRVATRRIIRSDNLIGLADTGITAMLDDLGIRLILDLRTARECEREGGPPAGLRAVRYLNQPLEPQGALTDADVAAGKATNLLDDYVAHLRISGPVLVESFELLARPDSLPAVVHCTAGKDRTGIFVALLLDLLGVEREAIVADYAATAPAMTTILERIRASEFFQENGLAAAPAWIFEAPPGTMRAFLDRLHAEHGGAAAWARGLGLSDATIAALRAALLEPR
jgi:protein-tyrosine phosphatase